MSHHQIQRQLFEVPFDCIEYCTNYLQYCWVFYFFLSDLYENLATSFEAAAKNFHYKENPEIGFEEAHEATKLGNYTGFYDFTLELFINSQYTKLQVEIDIFEEVFIGFFCFYFDFEDSSAVFRCYFYCLAINLERYCSYRCNKDSYILKMGHEKSNFPIH